MKEFFSLLALRFAVAGKRFIEGWKILFRYYIPHPRFAYRDLRLLLSYFGKSPYTISKQYLQQQGEKDVYLYGETPLTTAERMARAAHISQDDTVIDLGAGRGRVLFFLNALYGCRGIGIEEIPTFVTRANKLAHSLGLENALSFREEDLLDADLEEGSVFFLYGLDLTDLELRTLAGKIGKLPGKRRMITVSFSLNDYTLDRPFAEIVKLSLPFPWGITDVYISQTK